ncbi:GntR family transcriptional regulator [Virgibacillus kimchii]
MNLDKAIQKETLAEQGYRIIKHAIINNVIKPKETLVEEKIASELGISRTPIRKALDKLAFEGLVEIQPGKRAKVSSISKKDVKDYQLIRELLEPAATELAVSLATPKQVEFLRSICFQQSQAINLKDFNLFLDLDYQFHTKIAEYASNRKLKEFIVNLNSQIQRFLILSNTLHVRAEAAIEEHYKIVEKFEINDGNGAKKMMEKHVQIVTKGIID